MPLKLLLLHNINCLGSFVRSSLLCTLKGITSAHSRPSPSLFHHQPSLFSLCLSVCLSLSLYIYVFIYIQVYVYHVMSINDHILYWEEKRGKERCWKSWPFDGQYLRGVRKICCVSFHFHVCYWVQLRNYST